MGTQTTQISAATALVQLLEEHPELSLFISWSVPRTSPILVGTIHEGGMQVLAYCAEFLGGNVRAAHKTWERGGLVMRQHVLASTWRDVPVEVAVSLPVAESAQVAA